MTKQEEVQITGEFDHTHGVYRLTIEVPMNIILNHEYTMGRSTEETMLWVGTLITDEAKKLISGNQSGGHNG